jgi:hypothetical protein
MTLPEMPDELERGQIGHSDAMRWLGVDIHTTLVEIVHANARQMPGHRAGTVPKATRAVLRSVTKPAATWIAPIRLTPRGRFIGLKGPEAQARGSLQTRD